MKCQQTHHLSSLHCDECSEKSLVKLMSSFFNAFVLPLLSHRTAINIARACQYRPSRTCLQKLFLGVQVACSCASVGCSNLIGHLCQNEEKGGWVCAGGLLGDEFWGHPGAGFSPQDLQTSRTTTSLRNQLNMRFSFRLLYFG